MTEFTKVRTARVEHDCHPGCVIKPGERYVDEVIPPWVLVQDDVDDEGRPRGCPNGEWTRFARHATHLGFPHNRDGMIDLYHRTTAEAKAEILRTKVWRTNEPGAVYFSNRENGQAEGYGDTIIHIQIPRTWAELDDEFPDGEKHYKVSTVRAAHSIVGE
jgi:hypothetical protein